MSPKWLYLDELARFLGADSDPLVKKSINRFFREGHGEIRMVPRHSLPTLSCIGWKTAERVIQFVRNAQGEQAERRKPSKPDLRHRNKPPGICSQYCKEPVAMRRDGKPATMCRKHMDLVLARWARLYKGRNLERVRVRK